MAEIVKLQPAPADAVSRIPMIVTIPPVGRPKFPAADGEYLTPTGHALAKLLHRFRRSIPLVSARRYLVLRVERDRLRHDLHMQAIAMNRLERENRELMRKLLPDG